MKSLLDQIDRLRSELDTLRPLDPGKLNQLRREFKMDWNYHSNRMEGNTLTESETRTFLLQGITAKGKPFRDYLEMQGHDRAVTHLYEIVNQDLRITESMIKDFHRMILVEEFKDEQAEIKPGAYKTLNNYLNAYNGDRIDFASPKAVPELMNSLINWLNNHLTPPKRSRNKYNLHPLLISAGFHLQFIMIHPFGDGNGRLGRILSNMILMIKGYRPIVIREEDRKAYYVALNTSTVDNPEPLTNYFGEQLIKSLKRTITAASASTEDDLELIRTKLDKLNDRKE